MTNSYYEGYVAGLTFAIEVLKEESGERAIAERMALLFARDRISHERARASMQNFSESMSRYAEEERLFSAVVTATSAHAKEGV